MSWLDLTLSLNVQCVLDECCFYKKMFEIKTGKNYDLRTI